MKRQVGMEPAASKPQAQGPPLQPKKAPPRSDSKQTMPPSPGKAPAAEAAPPTPAVPAAAAPSAPPAVLAGTPLASANTSAQLAQGTHRESSKSLATAAAVSKQALTDPAASAEPTTAASQLPTSVKTEAASRSASPALGHHKQNILAAAMPASNGQLQNFALQKADGAPKAQSQVQQVIVDALYTETVQSLGSTICITGSAICITAV